ncbi:type II secretion system F family protein [Roseibacterium sp. SDUM158017]|uniref:type II secretion system F family protein n=1 Tax=Roseicyclus salinarum TaxID=3036773 RepID=UPI002414DC4C|nr:type II secretion system F family protein [Roseibacterium sp. SDUM158017]MDG4647344.1 type II secretion system F family protein [Roseibacterium sp. SDUM158017]
MQIPPTIWSQDAVFFLFAFLALGVFIAFTGVTQLLSRRESQTDARNRRMKMLAKGASQAEVMAVLKPHEAAGASRLPLVGALPRVLRQSGLGIGVRQFLLLCTLLVPSVGLLAYQFVPLAQAIAAGVVAGYVIPPLVVLHIRKRRILAMIHQLPDALDLLARGLRVGHPLNTSIGAIAREMQDPIASEFGLIFDQVSYGDDLPDAFEEFAERVDLEDVNYLSSSIGIQHGTGGDLAHVIEILSQVVRSRIALRRKIKAISAEGRLTAWFLSSLPLIILVMMTVSSPDYYGGVSDDPLFLPMAAAVVGFTLINALILRKLVNFKI